MEYKSLREEIIFVAVNEAKRLFEEGEIKREKKEEIENFLMDWFDKEYPKGVIEERLNEMILKFDELYIPLVSIDLSKYK